MLYQITSSGTMDEIERRYLEGSIDEKQSAACYGFRIVVLLFGCASLLYNGHQIDHHVHSTSKTSMNNVDLYLAIGDVVLAVAFIAYAINRHGPGGRERLLVGVLLVFTVALNVTFYSELGRIQ